MNLKQTKKYGILKSERQALVLRFFETENGRNLKCLMLEIKAKKLLVQHN